MLTKHKYLITYRYAEMIHDLTVVFCQKYLSYLGNLGNLREIPQRRTIDQMVQAARSGKQNIVEGVGQSRTSKKGEIKLLGVAEASIEELITDYEDFLRQRKLPIWPKTHPKIQAFRKRAAFLTNLGNLGHLGDLKVKPVLPDQPEAAANLMLTLCHMATYLLSKQIAKAETQFVESGGYTENLFKKRIQSKIQK
ncbi:four helix bundle suffix domain-containing protein [Patescibacteria group bacterium]|nr:four helix bundle suffix domain-containing protein [Patescibacteria group bacterium]MBU1472540.1 four helix bundle suffix domain-containing protein [Patescibacteria group bacterium]MBU2460087.1 four helix bundle suffix domain-containing protein [Patescibacteria group bacterium]MBU2544656.1 four helix bundle suffix domain-containing protein [Patescibacteria group bacterium]